MGRENSTHAGWRPGGTVYGVLLNFQREWAIWQPRMTEDPYKAPPQAPVLYVKSANTHCPDGSDLVLQDGIEEVEIGATLGLVFGEKGQINGSLLLNDWSLPHASYFRPPIKFRCRDGFLGLPPMPGANAELGKLGRIEITVRKNGAVVQNINLSALRRPIDRLVNDVLEFMTPQPGDILTVGCDVLEDGSRPRSRAGDLVEISAPGFAPTRHMVRSAS